MKFLKTDITNPVEFISCGHFISSVPWTHSERCIDSYEVLIGVHKTLYISQNGVEYELQPGQVLLLQPGLVHHGHKPCEAGVSFYWFHFIPSAQVEWLDEQEMARVWPALNGPDADRTCSDIYLPLMLTPQAVERINILFQQLQHIVHSNYYTRQSAHYLTTSLLIELTEQTITEVYRSAQLNKGDRNIAEIIEWVRIHAAQDISVADVASRFNYNRDYLSRFFKKKTGYNLQEYIHLLKIAKAKDILSRSSASVKLVSAKVGIEDEKYFMRLFKKYVQMTPTDYRKAYYKVHLNNH
ncbi:AraC family transcriptional regulator [Paenibacillus sp. P96]|uniref:AraC family transcriptional regulator n=1 Tax=Paenibacillus zeirhizosphaerae TaxID=2987519 RepID=A0ABT9FRD4_9BACL|nr:AraC family transcriptional regulator [Paenibacillus sp. P96]MDP4097270.1 AraC family transcriptional regulator [Paenibacillus sp. P96]